MGKLIGTILFSLGISFASIYFLNRELLPSDLEAHVIGKIWQQDIQRLEQAGQLPKSWWQIKEVDIAPLSSKSARWLRSIHPPIHYNEKGRFKLVIRLDSNTEAKTVAVIFHYTLIDLQSNNTLWEFGRTISIPNKKWLHNTSRFITWVKNFFPRQKEYSSVSPSLAQDHLKDPSGTQSLNTTPPSTDNQDQQKH